MIRTIRMSDGISRVRIVRVADETHLDAQPGSDAPEGREVLIFTSELPCSLWYRAIKVRCRGYQNARWKVFGAYGRIKGAFMYREFVPELFVEIPPAEALQ